MRWPWRKRWTVAIVGQESGSVTLLSFVTFRSQAKGAAWVAQANERSPSDLTRYELRELEQDRTPLLDREAVWWRVRRLYLEGGAFEHVAEEAADDVADAVLALARPVPTRAQILSATIAHIYEDDTAVVRQSIPEREWTLITLATDATVALLAGYRTGQDGRASEM